jgi:hypothetical protein
MESSESPEPTIAAFMADVEKSVSPIYADCLSEATIKVRDSLLIASVAVIALASGLVKTDGKFDVLGFSMEAFSRDILLVGIVAICGYFWLLFSLRSFSEWKAWRLRQQSPIMKLVDITNKLEAKGTLQSSQAILSIRKATDTYFERIQEPVRILELEAEYEKVAKELSEDSSHLRPDLLERWNRHRAISERLEHERDSWMKDVVEPAMATHNETLATANVNDVSRLVAQINYIASTLKAASRVTNLRLGIELVFPFLLGMSATAFGIVRSVHR